MFLIQVKFSCKRDKKIFLGFISGELIFLFWEKYSEFIFLFWEKYSEQISQIKKIFLSKFWGI